MNLETMDLSSIEQEISIREAQLKLIDCLPHLYGQKMYRWQRKFYESRHKYCVLTAANQVGKSAINIRKIIRWATDIDLWPKLWSKTPTQFWYLYPTGELATAEFENKWVREFLPRDELKNHPIYGWTKKMRNGDIEYVRFNSGVTIYFKTYAQDVHSLQAGSCHAIFADEEIPFSIVPELQMRISATNGYFAGIVFTATRGQEEWRRIIEEKGKLEMWKTSELDILKMQISTYDCIVYEDGTPSEIWSVEKIDEAMRFLHTDAQIQRRIYGRFVKDEGLKYPCFSRNLIIPNETINLKEGEVYAGVDYGSGTNHQSSICLVYTNKDHTYGIVFDLWVGEKGIPTTAGDVVEKYREMTKKIKVTQVFYDWASADLKTIANSSGLYFEKADKSHETGERILNTLFKNQQLKMMESDGVDILTKQLESLTIDEKKAHAWDDACDSLRYAVTRIPWFYENLQDKVIDLPVSKNPHNRHGHVKKQSNDELTDFDDEIREWNDIYEGVDFEDFGF